jgi:hypothetical protein
VLGGALVEALLLWAVGHHDIDARKAAIDRVAPAVTLAGRLPNPADPESWQLLQLIVVARELSEISETTAAQARLAKDFRNLIHPGREKRDEERPNRGTALSVVAAVEQVMRNLSERH